MTILVNHEVKCTDESIFFRRINIWALYEAGCTWDNPYNFKFANNFLIKNLEYVTEKRLSSLWLSRYLGKRKYVKYRNVNNLDFKWGWKDPRNTILLPLWARVFPNASIVHIYRNPIDVAESLRFREISLENNFKRNLSVRKVETLLRKKPLYHLSSRIHDIREGVKLWKEYVELAFDSDKYFTRVLHVKYEDFLENPDKILSELGKYLNLELDVSIINSIKNKINPSRSYAFLNKKELTDLYKEVKSDEWFKKLGYGEII